MAEKETVEIETVDVQLELTDTFEVWKDKFNEAINGFNAAIDSIPSEDGNLVAKDVAVNGDMSDLASDRGQIGAPAIKENTDIDTLLKTGIYSLTDTCTGTAPKGLDRVTTGILGVYESSTEVFQEYVLYNFNTINKWIRRYKKAEDDQSEGSWYAWQQISTDIKDIPVFKGATEFEAGESGTVPVSYKEDMKRALLGDGTWGDIATPEDVKTVDDKVTEISGKVDSVESKTEDIENRIDNAISNSTVVVITPTFTKKPSILAMDEDNEFAFSASAGLPGATIASFIVGLTGHPEQTVTATSNAGTASFHISEATDHIGKVATCTVIAIDSLGNRSKAATATATISEAATLEPVFKSPTDNGIITTEKVVWELGPFESTATLTGDTDEHQSSQFRIVSETSDEDVIYDSYEVVDKSKLTSWTIVGSLVNQGKCKLQARYKGKQYGWSAWASVTVEVKGIDQPTITSHQEGDEISRLLIVIETGAFAVASGIGTDTHCASEYKITKADTDEVLVQKERPNCDLKYVITNLSISEDTECNLSVRHKGVKLGWSKWSEPVKVKVLMKAQFDNEIIKTSAGTYTWTVPEGVTKARVLVCGGGAQGVNGIKSSTYNKSNGLGGKGGGIISAEVAVTPGDTISYTVGGYSTNSTFGSPALLTATGGTTSAHGTASYDSTLGTWIKQISVWNQSPGDSYMSSWSFREMSVGAYYYFIGDGTGNINNYRYINASNGLTDGNATSGAGAGGGRNGSGVNGGSGVGFGTSGGSAGGTGGSGGNINTDINGTIGAAGGTGGSGGNGVKSSRPGGGGGGAGGGGGGGGAGGGGNFGHGGAGGISANGGNGGSGGAHYSSDYGGGSGGGGGGGGGCACGNGGTGGSGGSTNININSGGGGGGGAGYGGNGGNGGYSYYRSAAGGSGGSSMPGAIVIYY